MFGRLSLRFGSATAPRALAGRPRPGGRARLVRGLVFASVAAAFAFTPATAQDLGGEAELRYREAVAEYESLRDDLDRSFNRYERALDVVDRSRGADASQREEAFAAFQTVAIAHMALEQETERALVRMNTARAAYARALQAREDELLSALARADLSPARQAQLESEWQRVRREMLELEPASDLEEAIALRPVPELRVEPTDGPTELREKANFMEEHALSYDSIIGDLEREILALEEQARRLRGLQDLQRDLGRFGQDLLPGARSGSPPVPDGSRAGDGGEPEDGNEPGTPTFASLPLPEQIELLRGTRELALQYREEALAMADVFRDRAEEFGP